MPVPTQEHIIEAVQHAAQQYGKGEPVSGVRKMAAEMDMSPSSLGNALNPYADRSSAKLGLEQALFIMERTGDTSALELMASHFGFTLQRLHPEPDHDDVRDEMLDDEEKLSLLQRVIRDKEHPAAIRQAAKIAKDDIDETVEQYRREWEEARA